MTAGAVIDMKNGKIKIEVNDESIVFYVFKMIKTTPPIKICGEINSLDIIDECIDKVVHERVGQNPLEISISQRIDEKNSNKEVVAYVRTLDSSPHVSPYRHRHYEPLRNEDAPSPSLASEAPKLELKPLPSTLRYAFLNPKSYFPFIINSLLPKDEVHALCDVLSKHKGVIGYSINDLKGLSPTIYMHRILLEEDSKPTIEA